MKKTIMFVAINKSDSLTLTIGLKERDLNNLLDLSSSTQLLSP